MHVFLVASSVQAEKKMKNPKPSGIIYGFYIITISLINIQYILFKISNIPLTRTVLLYYKKKNYLPDNQPNTQYVQLILYITCRMIVDLKNHVSLLFFLHPINKQDS